MKTATSRLHDAFRCTRWMSWVPASVAIVIASTVLAASSAAAQPKLGINVNRIFNDTWYAQAFADQQLSAASSEGVRLGRSDAFWMAVEPNPPQNGVHTYNWAFTDFIASNLAKRGIQWLPILDYSAIWAASTSDYHSPPTSNDDYAAYAKALAQRYGPGGAFWLANPNLPNLP